MARLLPLLLLALLSACARRVPPPETAPRPAIVDAGGDEVSDRELVERLESARYVLLGERHDDRCVHALQERVVRTAAAAKLPFAVGLEMVDVEYIAPFAQFNAGELDLPGLRNALGWEKNWGFDWWLYAPILEAAREGGGRVEPLNAPKRLMSRIGSPLPEDETDAVVREQWLTPVVIGPPPAQLAYLREAFDAHADHLPPTTDREAAFEKFVRAQSVWDTQMAWAARAVARETQRVFVVVGAGHVTNGWGIEHRLAELDEGAEVLSFVPWSGEGRPDPAEADLFFVCPATEGPGPAS